MQHESLHDQRKQAEDVQKPDKAPSGAVPEDEEGEALEAGVLVRGRDCGRCGGQVGGGVF